MGLFVMADLEMLVCDRTQSDVYQNGFIERLLLVTREYEKWVKDNKIKWLFSGDMLDFLLAYPWGIEIHNKADLYEILSSWLGCADKEFIEVDKLSGLKLEPDIHSAYVVKDYSDLDKEWRNILKKSAEINSNHTIIFSFDGKPDKVILTDTNNNFSKKFDLVKNHENWLTALNKVNPCLWSRYNLPKDGDYPYEPDDTNASDFPKEYYQPQDKPGFLDKKGRLWIPHIERQKLHWDVQCKKQGKDKYFKVSPEGQRLRGKPC